MKVLFLSMMYMTSLDESTIFSDLLKEFINHGHTVEIICPIEKRFGYSDKPVAGEGYNIYYTRVGNVTNTGFAEKGFSVIKLGRQIVECIKSNIGNKKIDLFLIAAAPVTFEVVVSYVKRHYNAKIYLLLKDIWPASMFDLKTPGGAPVKAAVSTVFRYWEKRLYKQSDKIGCLSNGNVRYVLANNSYLSEDKLEVNPNAITPRRITPLTREEKTAVRRRYNIPEKEICFVYGGTLGVGQNVAHIVKCLRACSNLNCHFVISGKGTQYDLLDNYVKNERPKNVTLINGLPKPEYEKLMQSCDIGLLFLRYTAQTPNIPSRILSYMEYGLPVLSCTDPVSDINEIIEEGKFGWGCLSDNESAFRNKIIEAMNSNLGEYGCRGRKYLEKNFCAAGSYEMIVRMMGEK